MLLHLTFALVGSLVQDGLGGYDFPIPEKQWGIHSKIVLALYTDNNNLFTFNIIIATMLR